MNTTQDSKMFIENFEKKLLENLKNTLINDEYSSKTELVSKGSMQENNEYAIILTVRNKESDFDMFSYIILIRLSGNNIICSATYKNQNITDTINFNPSTNNNEIIDKIGIDFMKRFGHSKTDFKKSSR